MSLCELRDELFGGWEALRTADGTIALFNGNDGFGVFNTPEQAYKRFMEEVS